MNRTLLSLPLLLLFAAATGCNGDPERKPSPPGNGGTVDDTPRATLTHGGANPFAATLGDFAFDGDDRGIAATLSGLVAVELTGPRAGMPVQNFSPWTLTSSNAFSAAATSLLVPPADRVGGKNLAFFLPSGQPQLGIVELEANAMQQGQVLTEAALAAPLDSPYPSALAAASDGVWIVDAAFGPGSSVRFYPYTSLTGTPPKLTEEAGRRYTPSLGDVDDDQVEDIASLNKLAFADQGRVALVSFSFVAPAPAGVAGGVLAFDTRTGAELGRLILPKTATSSTAIEFVGAVGATFDRVVLVSAHKAPTFADIGGTVAIYSVSSWSPFEVVDTNESAPYDQPESAIATSLANPVGLAIRGRSALVVNAPFFGEGSLDIIPVRAGAAIDSTTPLGMLYVGGLAIPGDPKLSSNGDTAIIPSEVGLLRVGLAD